MTWAEMPLVWLDGPPTEPGYYWWVWMYQPEGAIRMTQVWRHPDGSLVSQTDGAAPVARMMRYWFGPMPVPEGRPKKRLKGWEHG